MQKTAILSPLRHASVVLIFFLLFVPVLQAQTTTISPRQERLRQHVYFLASDSLKGRNGGSPDARKAALYIIDQYQNMGLKPFYSNFLVPFSNDTAYANVVACIEGSDPALRQEYVLVGAHYDHVGIRGGQVYNGADDNASGTAAVIELARILTEHRSELKRSVIIAAFDGEEQGLLGSFDLVQKMTSEGKLSQVKAMFSIDMVGWLKQGGKVSMEGAGMAQGIKKILDSVAEANHMPVKVKKYGYFFTDRTDSGPFAKKGIPAMYATTGMKSPYHKPEDDADLIDYPGLDRVTQYMADAVLVLSQQPTILATDKTYSPLNFSVAAGIGNSHISFIDADITTRRQFSYGAGFNVRWTLGIPAIQVGAYYDKARSFSPNFNATTPMELLSSSTQLEQQSVSIPASLLLQFGSAIKTYVGAGGYYRYVFEGKANAPQYKLNPEQWGWQFLLGLRYNQFDVSLTWSYQLNELYLPTATATEPTARLNGFRLTLNYAL